MFWVHNLSLEIRRTNAYAFATSQLRHYDSLSNLSREIVTQIKMHFLAYILGGIVSIAFGIIVLFEGGYSNVGIWVGGRLPGIAAIVFGIISFCMVPKAIKSHEKKTKHGNILKCPDCGKVFSYEEANDLKCSVCSVQLENLSGFFQRHPNFDK